MALVKFFKLTELPTTPVADALYFIENGTIADAYVTTSSGQLRLIGNTELIEMTVSPLLANLSAEAAAALAAFVARRDNPHQVTKAQVGLGSADNTPDLAKPVSVAQASADAAVAAQAAADLATFAARRDNPNQVTKSQVGLGNVDNTSDVNKPVSTAQAAADTAVANQAATALANFAARRDNPNQVTKAQVGLGSAEDKSSATIRSELTAGNVSTALGFAPVSPGDLALKAPLANPVFPGNVTVTATLDANKVTVTQLGVGTTNPIHPLDVVGTVRVEGNLLGRFGTAAKWRLSNDDSFSYILAPKVGINAANPLASLDVQGDKMFMSGAGAATAGGVMGAQMYLGDANFRSAEYFSSAPGIGGVYDASSQVGGSLGLFVYNGLASTRLEVARAMHRSGAVNTSTFWIKDEALISGNMAAHGTSYFGPSGMASTANRTVIDGAAGGRLYQYDTNGILQNLIQGAGNSYLLSGNFGLGTNTPEAKLEVVVNAAGATAEALRLTNNGLGVNSQSAINFASYSTIYGQITGGYGPQQPEMSFNLPNASAGNFIWKISGTETARLNHDGNLGLGTAEPEARLHVKGGLLLQDPTSTTLRKFKMDVTTDGSMRFLDSISGERMRINWQGRIGVGTNLPDSKFHVVGSAGSGFRVDYLDSGNIYLDAAGGTVFNINGVQKFIVAPGGVAVEGEITSSGNLSVSGGALSLINTNSNALQFSQAGVGAPSFNSRSIGTKILLYPAISSSAADYAIGITDGVLWNSVPTQSTLGFKWFAGITEVAYLSGTGALTLADKLTLKSSVNISDAAGTNRSLYLNTAGVTRWAMTALSLAETGSGNTGSDFGIARYSDNGTYLGLPMIIRRANGFVGFNLSVPSAQVHAQVADGANSLGLSGSTRGLRVEHNATSTVLRGVDHTLSVSYQPLTLGGQDLRFEINGATEAMRITSQGNVGIGVTSPEGKLHVYMPGNSAVFVGDSLITPSVNPYQFKVAGQDKVVITNLGNVGIGVNNPDSKLVVVGRDASLPATAGTDPLGAILRLKPQNSNGVLDFGNAGSGASWIQATNITALSEKYSILLNPQGGNVGVGVLAPDSVFQVSSGANNGLRINYQGLGTNYFDSVGAQYFRVAGVNEFQLDSAGASFNKTVRTGGSLVIGAYGAYEAGSIYADVNYGMLFRAKTNAPNFAYYSWRRADASELMYLRFDGVLVNHAAIEANNYIKARFAGGGGASLVGTNGEIQTGYVSFTAPNGDRLGYIGYNSGSGTIYSTDGAGNHIFYQPIRISALNYLDIAPELEIGRAGSSASVGQSPGIKLYDSATTKGTQIQSHQDNLQIFHHSPEYGGWIERMRVASGGDVEVSTIGKGIVIRSPDGTKYRITVANGGALSAVAV